MKINEDRRVNLLLDGDMLKSVIDLSVTHKSPSTTQMLRTLIKIGIMVLEIQTRGESLRYTDDQGKEVQLEIVV